MFMTGLDGILVVCVMSVTMLTIKKAVSCLFINASVPEASVGRVMRFVFVELHLMGT